MSHNDRSTTKDPDASKGAVEQDRPGQPTNTDNLKGQNRHRPKKAQDSDYDTDFPEPGNTPEYSMQKRDDQQDQNARQPDLHPKNDPDGNAEGRLNDQDPGHAQKRNQNDKKDDDLAA